MYVLPFIWLIICSRTYAQNEYENEQAKNGVFVIIMAVVDVVVVNNAIAQKMYDNKWSSSNGYCCVYIYLQ